MASKRGPKPKTTRLRAVIAPEPEPEQLDPNDLGGIAEAAAEQLRGRLRAAKKLEQVDPVLIEAYGLNVALLRAARRQIEDDGLMQFNGAGALAPHPATQVINAATMRIKSVLDGLGTLTPEASSTHGSKWGSFFGGDSSAG